MTAAEISDRFAALQPSPRLRLMLLVVFAVAVCFRLPTAVWEGRFYGEEGPFFFAYAWHMPWREALTHTLGGYLTIVASGGTLMAEALVAGGWTSLEQAPHLTQAIALCFQLCPAALILTSRAPWLKPWWAAPAALALLATPALTEEVWLNTLHSQFHIALAVTLILATDLEGGRALTAFRFFLLALGPLSGPASIVLTPFFALRAVIEGRRERWAQTAVLAASSATQLLFFFTPNPTRSLHFDPHTLLAASATHLVVLPLAGRNLAASFGLSTQQVLAGGHVPWSADALAVLTLGAFAYVAARRWQEGTVWLLAPAYALALIGYAGGVSAGPDLALVTVSPRYSFLPQVLMALTALAMATTEPGRLGKAAGYACAWVALIGLTTFITPITRIALGPDWRAEVAKWRADPDYQLAVWPSAYRTDLSASSRRCSADPADPHPPNYCDLAWERIQLGASAAKN